MRWRHSSTILPCTSVIDWGLLLENLDLEIIKQEQSNRSNVEELHLVGILTFFNKLSFPNIPVINSSTSVFPWSSRWVLGRRFLEKLIGRRNPIKWPATAHRKSAKLTESNRGYPDAQMIIAVTQLSDMFTIGLFRLSWWGVESLQIA